MYSMVLWLGLFVGFFLLGTITRKLLKNKSFSGERTSHPITPDMAINLSEKEAKLVENLKKITNEKLQIGLQNYDQSVVIYYQVGSGVFDDDDEIFPAKVINEVIENYKVSGWNISSKVMESLNGSHIVVTFSPKKEYSMIRAEVEQEVVETMNHSYPTPLPPVMKRR
jgi:hypothetical protein